MIDVNSIDFSCYIERIPENKNSIYELIIERDSKCRCENCIERNSK